MRRCILIFVLIVSLFFIVFSCSSVNNDCNNDDFTGEELKSMINEEKANLYYKKYDSLFNLNYLFDNLFHYRKLLFREIGLTHNNFESLFLFEYFSHDKQSKSKNQSYKSLLYLKSNCKRNLYFIRINDSKIQKINKMEYFSSDEKEKIDKWLKRKINYQRFDSCGLRTSPYLEYYFCVSRLTSSDTFCRIDFNPSWAKHIATMYCEGNEDLYNTLKYLDEINDLVKITGEVPFF